MKKKKYRWDLISGGGLAVAALITAAGGWLTRNQPIEIAKLQQESVAVSHDQTKVAPRNGGEPVPQAPFRSESSIKVDLDADKLRSGVSSFVSGPGVVLKPSQLAGTFEHLGKPKLQLIFDADGTYRQLSDGSTIKSGRYEIKGDIATVSQGLHWVKIKGANNLAYELKDYQRVQ